MKKFFLLLAGVFLFLPVLMPTSVLASTFRMEENVPAEETVEGNLYLSGASTVVAGTVNGDLVSAGGTVVVTGNIQDDALIFGGTINISGTIHGDARVAGGNLLIDGSVGGDVITFGGQVEIGPHAVIGGDLIAQGGDVKVNPAAQVKGERYVKSMEYKEAKEDLGDFWKKNATSVIWFSMLMGVLTVLVVAAFIFGLCGNLTQRVVSEAIDHNSFWSNFGVGFLLLIVSPIVAISCLITGVGALLGGVILLVYILAIFISTVFAGIVLGGLLNKYIKKSQKNHITWFWLVLGVVGLQVLGFVPFIGGLLWFVLLMVCVGSLVKVKWLILKIF